MLPVMPGGHRRKHLTRMPGCRSASRRPGCSASSHSRMTMKIKRVRIENFCCLRSLDVSFDSITSLIGPTGVGKSTVLRALDWFFNGEKGGVLSEEDVHS